MPDEIAEEWRAVTGYQGLYEVSDLGRVRSLGRRVPSRTGSRTTNGKVLRPWSHNSYGHLAVKLSADGRVTKKYVHFLVAEAFHGPRPGHLEVRHGNGIGTDNRASNLSWSTHAQNMSDMVEHGTSHAGKTHCSRGHEKIAPNVKPGSGLCLKCNRIRQRAYKERKRAQAGPR